MDASIQQRRLMDWLVWFRVGLATCGWLLVSSDIAFAAAHRTPNFIVNAPTPEFARQVGEAAEVYRRELAIEWTGAEMPKWASPCPISVKVGNLGAGGATTFHFDRGEVFGWKMSIQGTPERILDSVLPHEINHTVFACYFRRPLPRWADEGAASLIEHESERMRLRSLAEQVNGTNRKIPLQKLLRMKDYPTDSRQVLTLYAEGYVLADYLIEKSNKRTYLAFLKQALGEGWEPALQQHYGYGRIDELEREWDRWVVAGSPRLRLADGTLIAANTAINGGSQIRGQSPAGEELAGEELSLQEPQFAEEPSPWRIGNSTHEASEAVASLSAGEINSAEELFTGSPGNGPIVRSSISRANLTQPLLVQVVAEETGGMPPVGSAASRSRPAPLSRGWNSDESRAFR
jgi:hypothetical protein